MEKLRQIMYDALGETSDYQAYTPTQTQMVDFFVARPECIDATLKGYIFDTVMSRAMFAAVCCRTCGGSTAGRCACARQRYRPTPADIQAYVTEYYTVRKRHCGSCGRVVNSNFCTSCGAQAQART